MPRKPREPMLPLPVPMTRRMPGHRVQDERWAQLDASRPHATRLTPAERIEFERLDAARYHRNLRKGLA